MGLWDWLQTPTGQRSALWATGLGEVSARTISGFVAARDAKQQARQYEQLASMVRADAEREGRRQVGLARVALAKAGGRPGEGSAADVARAAAIQAEVNALREGFGLQLAAEDTRQEGRAALSISLASGARSFLATAKRDADLFPPMRQVGPTAKRPPGKIRYGLVRT